MIHIQRAYPDPSALRAQKVKRARDELTRLAQAGEVNLKFNSDLYAARDVKQMLIEMQHGKCCFCESQITHVAYGDVEHFRPQAGRS
jgi:hypothetical protein